MNVTDTRFADQVTSCPSVKCKIPVIWCASAKTQLLIDADPVAYVAGQPYGEYALRDLGDLRPTAVKLKPAEVFGRQGTLHRWHYETCPQGRRYQRKAYQR